MILEWLSEDRGWGLVAAELARGGVRGPGVVRQARHERGVCRD